MIGWGNTDDYEKGKKSEVGNVRQVGQQATYRRGRVWVASNAADLEVEKDKAKIQDVDRFSEEYFRLVRANTVSENQIFASQRTNEELVIRLRGQAYRIR